MVDEETTVEETTVQSMPEKVVTTKRQVSPTHQEMKTKEHFEVKKSIFRTYQIIWYILGFIEVVLAFRLFLKGVGANPVSGFVVLIYALSDPFALPFNGVLRVTATPAGSLFEWSTLVAMAVYWIVAYGIANLFQFLKPVSRQEVEESVDTV